MDLAEAVRVAVDRTGHRRYAELLDPAHPDFNLAYEPIVRAIAEGRAPESIAPVAQAPARTQGADNTHSQAQGEAGRRYLARCNEAKRCPQWRKPDCGCRWGECAAGKGDRGQLIPEDCFACLGI